MDTPGSRGCTSRSPEHDQGAHRRVHRCAPHGGGLPAARPRPERAPPVQPLKLEPAVAAGALDFEGQLSFFASGSASEAASEASDDVAGGTPGVLGTDDKGEPDGTSPVVLAISWPLLAALSICLANARCCSIRCSAKSKTALRGCPERWSWAATARSVPSSARSFARSTAATGS
jgi:hypothetical protein